MNVSAILTVVHVKSSYFRPEKNNLFVKLPYSKEICLSFSYLIRKKGECTAQNKEQTYLAQPIRHETVSRILRSSSNKPEQLMVKKET